MNNNSFPLLTVTMRSLLICILILVPLTSYAQRRLTPYVDPFIGTGGHGHTFPGAIMPFGMVQLSPDTRLTGWDGCSGYHYSDNVVYGFSHTHLSGTGISDYGDILLMPTVGEVFLNALNGTQTNKGYASHFSHRNEIAQPGFYSVKLDDENILVELTTTRRAGFHRYTYPSTNAANVVLDLTHRDRVIDSGLRITGQNTLVGWRRSDAWAKDQLIFFAAEFSQPFTSFGIAVDDKKQQSLREAQGKNLKAYFRFDASTGRPVLVKVGISATSIDGALRNLAAEIHGWDFDDVRKAASDAWETELRKIEVSGGTESQLKNFYTALYHTMTAPNLFMDVDGQYRGRDFKNHRASGFENYTVFSLWDTFRAAHPLYTIIDQKRTVDFVNTFLAQYDQGGRLPVWELAANETDTMIGYHGVSVIADAAVKGIGGFDLAKAFMAMKQSAEARRFGLDAYQDHGYIGMEEERESVSRTLEYAYDDWCIAEVARLLGRPGDYRHYLQRAQFYKNVFDGESGFMRPRSNAGWLSPFEPREVNFGFTEANSWQYSFFVPQDVTGLMSLMGGKEKFIQKLDELFSADSRTTGREQADITGLIGQYAHGNEPSHHMAYLYNYAGAPWKTQQRVRQILDSLYKPEPDGLSGNEDCGQMSAWYVLSAAGFYSVTPGSPVYAIGGPLFSEIRFNLENGKRFVIRAGNVSDRNIYIQSARLNNRSYQKSYISQKDIMVGGELVFEMGPRPNMRWGVGEGNIPVSVISEAVIVPVPIINAAGKTFKGQMTVTISPGADNSSKAVDIYYTTDGSQPNLQSKRFSKPFFIDGSTTIKALAVDRSQNRSLIATAHYHRIPHNWSLLLKSRYSNQYPASGDLALIDGIRGRRNWSGGDWQGYQGQDLVAVVDLGQVQNITSLGAGFLQDVGSWIWMPRRVDFEVSLDATTFRPVLSLTNDVPDGSKSPSGVVMKDFKGTITPQAARYVRIRALNFGKIPDWHPGVGGDAWIFADEIFVN